MIGSLGIAPGAIRNGYIDIESARKSLNGLRLAAISTPDLTPDQLRKLEGAIENLTDYITYYDLTEQLLAQFRAIGGDLYHEIDAIVDKNGKTTDVYIKFVPRGSGEVTRPGSTYLVHKEGDNTNYSEYGAQTVSVKIWIMSTSLSILAHELGHVKYEVPNLASYSEYYKRNYRSSSQPEYIGHHPSDPSGRSAALFEEKFSKEYKAYLKGSLMKVSSPFALLAQIRNRNRTVHSFAIAN
jgi:hypothetical protein